MKQKRSLWHSAKNRWPHPWRGAGVLYAIFIITAPPSFSGYRIYSLFLQTVPPCLGLRLLGLTLSCHCGDGSELPAVVAFFRLPSFAWFSRPLIMRRATWVGFAWPWPGALGRLYQWSARRKVHVPSIMADPLAQFFWYGGRVLRPMGSS